MIIWCFIVFVDTGSVAAAIEGMAGQRGTERFLQLIVQKRIQSEWTDCELIVKPRSLQHTTGYHSPDPPII